MREETRLKFEREVRKQWIKRGAYAVGGLVVVAALAWFTNLDAHVEIQNGLNVDVKLDDGRHAHVMAMKTTHPEVGTRIAIIEHVHWSGRTTFSWK
jgi:hypothetical protein